jgi:hypothetical protein
MFTSVRLDSAPMVTKRFVSMVLVPYPGDRGVAHPMVLPIARQPWRVAEDAEDPRRGCRTSPNVRLPAIDHSDRPVRRCASATR